MEFFMVTSKSKSGKIITRDDEIKEILATSKTIAVLGLSPKPERDSNRVARYLKEQGYRIIPVRPGQKEILGEKTFASLDDIKEPVDIVDVFRRSDQIMPHAQEALRLKPKVFWMQLDIENQEAAELLTESGIDVVMNMCIKVEHNRLF
jgi:predicted CoA-binding protein